MPGLDPTKIRITFVDTLDDALELKGWMAERRDFLGVDIETTGLQVFQDKIRLVQLGDPLRGWAMDWNKWGGLFGELISGYDRRIVAHNALFELKHLGAVGINMPQHLVHDSMIMAHFHNPMLAIGLKNVSQRMYGPWAVAGEKTLHAAMSKQGWTWATVPIDFPPYWLYGALDTILCSKVAEDLWPQIQPMRNLYDIELAELYTLRDAELTGIMTDQAYVHQQTSRLLEEKDAAHAALQHAGVIPNYVKNPGSDDQVIGYMQRMGAQLWKLTDKGNLSCDDDVLKEQEKAGIPWIGEIRKWRNAKWIENNYFKNLREMALDGVIRPSVKPVGAKTGRMSIEKPALQTIPRGPLVRDAFVAREGHTLITADYDQLELRLLAHFAEEEAMLQAINVDRRDLHDFVAESLYGANFTKAQRQVAKNAQFAIVYGAGLDQFARTAGLTNEEAQEFFTNYGKLFPGVPRFQQWAMREVYEKGYVTSAFGRKLPVAKDKAYVATNYIIQPSATADLIKLKIIETSNAGLQPYFRLPIHDELMFEVPDDLVEDVAPVIEDVMTETQLFRARLDASAVRVKRWGDKSRLEA